MNEEKIKILKMLEEKKITSDEAMQLLETMERMESKESHEKESRGRLLKIRVHEGNATNPQVNINVPIAWAKFLTPFLEGKLKQKLEEKGCPVDTAKIHEAIENAEPIKIIDVKDGDEHVEISIE